MPMLNLATKSPSDKITYKLQLTFLNLQQYLAEKAGKTLEYDSHTKSGTDC
jgi:hypothetical protein